MKKIIKVIAAIATISLTIYAISWMQVRVKKVMWETSDEGRKAASRELDIKNLRNMFHLSTDVKTQSYYSSPQIGGFFGREGLKIAIVFQFDQNQLTQYQKVIEQENLWPPIPFEGRLPRTEKEYSARSLGWNRFPIIKPSSKALRERFSQLQNKEQIHRISKGTYRCTVSEYEEKGKAPIDAKFKRWACDEFLGPHLAFTLGVLDVENKKLYVEYQM